MKKRNPAKIRRKLTLAQKRANGKESFCKKGRSAREVGGRVSVFLGDVFMMGPLAGGGGESNCGGRGEGTRSRLIWGRLCQLFEKKFAVAGERRV